jgi:single-strand DNA-binding protein
MMQLNRITLVGNVVRDPELRYTPAGDPVAKISIAANQTYGSADERKTATTFVEVEVWNKSGENLSKLVKQGQEIYVEGALRQDNWQDKATGQNRSKLFIRAENWQFTQHAPKRDAQEVATER